MRCERPGHCHTRLTRRWVCFSGWERVIDWAGCLGDGGLVGGGRGLDLGDSAFADEGVEVEQGLAFGAVTFGEMVAGIDVIAEEQG